MTPSETHRPGPRAIAATLVRDEPALLSSCDFGRFVRQGIGSGPSVWIGDQVGIPLFNPDQVGHFDHRLAPLARSGDTVIVRTRDPDYEAYLADYLGNAGVTYVNADPQSRLPVAAQCARDLGLRSMLAAVLRERGALTLQPYVAHGHVWQLAAGLAGETGLTVHVAGPGPRIMRRSNDKLWFWDVARQVAGARAVPPTWAAYGPAAAAGHVARVIRLFGQAVVKVPDSAGAAGNLVIDGEKLAKRSPVAIRDVLVAQLAAMGWRETYPVLVGVWESGITRSPSAQIWIPTRSDGPPEVLGLFEQVVEGTSGAFAGARPARFPPDLKARMVQEAVAIGEVLQHAGYFGACSLDAVIRDTPDAPPELHWIECNGRWSGVSIPIAAVHRHFAGRQPGGLVILQTKITAPGVTGTNGLLSCLGDVLFRKGDAEGMIVLSPPPSGDRLMLNAVTLADTQARADDIAQAGLARLARGA